MLTGVCGVGAAYLFYLGLHLSDSIRWLKWLAWALAVPLVVAAFVGSSLTLRRGHRSHQWLVGQNLLEDRRKWPGGERSRRCVDGSLEMAGILLSGPVKLWTLYLHENQEAEGGILDLPRLLMPVGGFPLLVALGCTMPGELHALGEFLAEATGWPLHSGKDEPAR